MQKRTAEKVADVLGLAEQYISLGRPRKRPGKDRPEAINDNGNPVKVTKSAFWYIGQVSLVGAVKMACLEQGYSAQVRRYVEDYLSMVREGKTGFTLAEIDNLEWDTRQLQRDLRAARRIIEKVYLS